jgi:cell wall-associated NlpC family hydrolase
MRGFIFGWLILAFFIGFGSYAWADTCDNSANAAQAQETQETDNQAQGSANSDGSQEVTRKRSIIQVAKEWIGTPYARSGTRFSGQNAEKGVGADCSGVIHSIYAEAGYGYDYQSVSQFVASSGDGRFKAISRSQLQPGDVVIWLHSYKVRYKKKYVVRTKNHKKLVRYKIKHKTVRISHMAIYDVNSIWTTHSQAEDKGLGQDTISRFTRSFHGIEPCCYYHYIGFSARPKTTIDQIQQVQQANQEDQELQEQDMQYQAIQDQEVQGQEAQNQEVQEQAVSEAKVPTSKAISKRPAKPAVKHTVKSTKKTTVKHTKKRVTKNVKKSTKKSTVKITKKNNKKNTVKHTIKPAAKSPVAAGVSAEKIISSN